MNRRAVGEPQWKEDKEGDTRSVGGQQWKNCKEDFQDLARQHGQRKEEAKERMIEDGSQGYALEFASGLSKEGRDGSAKLAREEK